MEEYIAKGFDRDIDFDDIKNKLIKDFEQTLEKIKKVTTDYNERIYCNRIIYCIIAMTQLVNGSRISEACRAVQKFHEQETINDNDRVVVKISKSEKLQYNRVSKEKFMSKARFRKMRYPTKWINSSDYSYLRRFEVKTILCLNVKDLLLRQRVRDYLLNNFNCNTHSLRYAFINYMLHDKGKPMNEVAKFVGHKNTNQICTYTQNKKVDMIFDMDI